MVSESGDFVGGGTDRLFATPAGTLSISGALGHVEVSAFGEAGWFSLNFAAPSGSQLEVGEYTSAQRYPFEPSGSPGLAVSGDGRGCNADFGRFIVKAIQLNGSGEVDRFWALYEQHCEGATAPPLFGEVRIGEPPTGAPEAVRPAAIDWPNTGIGASAVQVPVTVIAGESGAQVTAVAVEGQDAGDFSVSSDGCAGMALAAGASCQLAVNVKPTASGNRLAQLVVSDTSGAKTNIPLAVFAEERGRIAGIVVSSATKAPIAEVLVCALNKEEKAVACAETGSKGEYSIAVAPGSCKVGFDAQFLGYVIQYYDESPSFSSATSVSVSAGSRLTAINASLKGGGEIGGAVLNGHTGKPLGEALVCALTTAGEVENCEYTNAAGQYEIKGLAARSYVVGFDAGTPFPLEYYDDVLEVSRATLVSVQPEMLTSAINATMPPEPSFTIEQEQKLAGEAGYTTSKLAGKAGQTVDYEVTVKNTGYLELTLGSLSDSKCENLAPSGSVKLAVGASQTYTCEHKDLAVGVYTNVATISNASEVAKESAELEIEVLQEAANGTTGTGTGGPTIGTGTTVTGGGATGPTTGIGTTRIGGAAAGGGTGGRGRAARGKAHVGKASTSGDAARTSVWCVGASGASCTIMLSLSVTEIRDDTKLIRSAARNDGRRARRTVDLGSTTATLTAGQRRTMHLTLSATGQTMLKTRHTLTVALTASSRGAAGSEIRVSRQVLHFKTSTKKSQKPAATTAGISLENWALRAVRPTYMFSALEKGK